MLQFNFSLQLQLEYRFIKQLVVSDFISNGRIGSHRRD